MNIYEKMLKIQEELKAPKGQRNNFGNYNYRSCEDILESLKPLLVKNKATLFINDNVEMVGERIYVKAIVTFVDVETGEKVSVSAYAREEENKKGMDSSQVTGACSSYARKYALNGLFAIDDTKDADATNTHGKELKATSTNLSDKQVKRLYAIALSKGVSKDTVDRQVKKKFSKGVTELNKNEYDLVVNGYEKMGDKNNG